MTKDFVTKGLAPMKQLPTQLGDPEAVKAVLKHAAFTIALESGDEVQAMAMYLPAMDGKSSYDQFFELIKNGILENFVFSCTEIQKKTGSNRKIDAEELLQKALRKLSRHTAKGELGELILFTLLDVYLGAPKLLSKVSMKTNPRMPVYGADAVHGQFHDGAFRLYLGESKLQKDFKAAAKKAATSISSAKAKYDDEFDLLDSYIDFPNIDDETESEILSILNPFSESHQADIVHSPCFIGFTNPILIATDGGFDKFLNAYNLIAKEHFKEFYDQIREYGLPANESVLLILPFTCVDNLVDEFVEYMGIEN